MCSNIILVLTSLTALCVFDSVEPPAASHEKSAADKNSVNGSIHQTLTPTFLSSSPTMFRAEILADMVRGVAERLSPAETSRLMNAHDVKQLQQILLRWQTQESGEEFLTAEKALTTDPLNHNTTCGSCKTAAEQTTTDLC